MRNLFFEERLDKSFFAERAYLLLKGIAGVPYDTLSLPVDAYGIAAVYMQEMCIRDRRSAFLYYLRL